MTRLEKVVRAERLLVALDFDGTIAHIVPTPDLARPLEGVREAVQVLLECEGTSVAIISGRDARDLHTRLEGWPVVWLAGSHGRTILAPGQEAGRSEEDPRLDWVRDAPLLGGIRRECKEFSVAFHWRGRHEGEPVGWVRNLVLRARAEGLEVLEGRQVLEVLVPGNTKDIALRDLQDRTSSTAIVYAGDDRTDLEAIRVADESGVGVFVKSGERPWIPPPGVVQLEGPGMLVGWLERLAQDRLAGSGGRVASPRI